MNNFTSSIAIKVNVGKLEVVTSGVVHLENETSFSIKVNTISLSFNFRDDTGQTRYEGKVVGDDIQFDLYNHNNVMGEGMLTPLSFCTVDGRPVYFTYYCHTISIEKKSRRLDYVIYIGEKND